MYCVITGASSGFGREFANQFAARNYDLCIAARNIEKLTETKTILEQKYKIRVDALQCDLTTEEGIAKLYEFTKDKNVDILVNNAGILTGGMPDEIDLDKELVMIQTNVVAVNACTRLFLKDMLERNRGKILNVSSLSAWTPTPLLSSYGACKAYILSLSSAINHELRSMKSNVTVTAVTPGFFNTNIAGKDFVLENQNRAVDRYIDRIVTKFLAGKSVINLGIDKSIPFLRRIWPKEWLMELAYQIVAKNLRKA